MSSSMHKLRSIVVPGISGWQLPRPQFGVLGAQQLPLEGIKGLEDAVARVRNFVLANPDNLTDRTRVITGGGWDHTSKDCHSLWVSSTALELSFPLPNEVKGGTIVRDEHGNPAGVLLDNAQELLKQPGLTEGGFYVTSKSPRERVTSLSRSQLWAGFQLPQPFP
ncbi:hypothetical protein BKA70DRAFT_1231219 [Coprinopsis sp. MPI-PUGE-AT-0042]|nr:hypothetical protein BKA70DRAFT_1231219 [Coprinopsis sp. MPI-PUGE-AT-0042]